MKSLRWIALLVVVSLGSYYYHSQKEGKLPDAPVVKISPQPSTTPAASSSSLSPLSIAALVSKRITTEPVQPTGVKAKVPARFTEKPKDRYVSFEVVNGYAVAFGDVVMGKPLNDFQEKTGMAEVRPPRYWDHGEIPYSISNDVVNPDRVKLAIEFFNQRTNVKFVPFNGEKDSVVFVKGEANCSSYLGRAGGAQPIFLHEKCGTPEIEHELMHALGFVHEQSRTDRDQFVEILWNNIEEKFHLQYAMVPEELMEAFYDSAFNPTSIMMYESHIFAKSDGLETMKGKNNLVLEQPSRSLNDMDIARVNRLYPK